MKKIVVLIMINLLMFSVVSCGEKSKSEIENNTEVAEDISCKLIISCNEIIEYMDDEAYGIKEEKKEIVPHDGIILEIDTKCDVDSTAYDIVVSELKKNKIHFDGSDGYLKAIANLYVGDCGEFSGWMFFINGNLAENGASDTIINENDIIEFKYIVDYNTLFE